MKQLVDKGDHHVLIARMDDDTMIVICHWHYMPTKEEVSEMTETVTEDEYIVEFFVT